MPAFLRRLSSLPKDVGIANSPREPCWERLYAAQGAPNYAQG